MPSWSSKDERQYEHIKESEEQRGEKASRAEEIAARTVNKHRRLEGRTPSRRTQGTGNPTHSLSSRSKAELVNRAEELHIRNARGMSKDELVKEIRRKE